MNILYGCCYHADLFIPNVTYLDIIPNLKKSYNCHYICDDIKNCNFKDYDILILTPPCNYYSRCNYRRDTSLYALNTKDLLPYCIEQAALSKRPFIVENVRSPKLFKKCGIFDLCSKYGVYVIKYDDMNNKQHQGGYNVNNCILHFLSVVTNKEVFIIE